MKQSFGQSLAVLLTSLVGLHSLTSVCHAVPWKLSYKDGEKITLQQVSFKSEGTRPVLGTFWFMQRMHFPPLPCYPSFLTEAGYDVPVYALESERGIYLVDDRTVDYEAIYKEREKKKQELTLLRSLELNMGLMSMEEFSLLEGGGGMALMSYTSDDLWLEIISYTNTTASLVIHRPVDDDNPSHDIIYSTDLAYPTNWHFLMRTFKTNVLATDLCDIKGFFRLSPTNGTLTINTTNTALNMAQRLVPPWATVTNANYKGSSGSKGTFTGGHGAGLPIETGVILSSGLVEYAIGTNNYGGQGIPLGTDPDDDLDLLCGTAAKNDAAVLEFDVVSTNSFYLYFKYIYASEEYPNYISLYNDPMGIFITTNRVGTNWINAVTNNIAVVPGTTNGPVSAGSINGGFEGNLGEVLIEPANPQFYVDNFDPILHSIYTNAAPSSVFNTQFDGMTVLLSAKCWIQASVVHRIKIGVEDYNDASLDSVVFVRDWEMDACGQNQ